VDLEGAKVKFTFLLSFFIFLLSFRRLNESDNSIYALPDRQTSLGHPPVPKRKSQESIKVFHPFSIGFLF